MNLRKKIQGFFTLTRKANGGFTLVELIVVIAILAILAGAAVPAYNGYINKANEAADQQLLAAINTAFAAACLEDGKDMADLEGASMPLNADKTVNGAGAQPAEHADGFVKFFSGNDGTAFKVFESIVFDPDKHVFVNREDAGRIAITVNGKTYIASGEDVKKLLDSTWAKELDADYMLNMVAGVADMVQNGYNTTFSEMISKGDYKIAAASALGLDNSSEYDAYIDQLIKAKYPDGSAPTSILNTQRETYKKQIDANVAVLVAAQGAQSAGQNIIGILTKDNGANAMSEIKGSVNASNPTEGLSQAALAYGLYNAYVYQNAEIKPEDKENAASVVNALQNFDDPDFQKYLKSDQGKKDLDGLLASLNVASTQNKDTAGSVVTDGVNNSNLINALEQLLGK